MSYVHSKILSFFRFIRDAFTDEQFYVALRHVIGAFIPMIVCEVLGHEQLGMQMLLGAFFISGVDIAGTFRAKLSGLIITTLISVGFTFLLLLPDGNLWAVIPLLFVMIFGLAFISPFSLRYTMIAVMGYIAIIIALAFSQNINSLHGTFMLCFHLLWGSVWYILYALAGHYLARVREINRRITTCMQQTAHYFDQRLALLGPESNDQEGLMKLARLQQQLNSTQQSLRELLFQYPSVLTHRGSKQHRLFVIFVELVDMHEMAMATPIDYPKMRNLLHRYPEYNIIRKIIRRLNRDMQNMADVLLNQSSYNPPDQIKEYVDQLHKQLQEFQQNTSLDDGDEQELYDALKRIEEYLHHQIQKVKKVRSAVLDRRVSGVESSSSSTNIAVEDLPRLVSPSPLNWNSVIGNFSFDSSYFRYALRTAVTAILGYVIGYIIDFKNPYWILLTVLLVMKPGYGATKQRFYHRIGGTIIGALIAYIIYLGRPPHLASLAIFGVSFLLAFTFVVKNYAVSSGFFTLFIIFLYSFLSRPVPVNILFRVADTVLGGILVMLALFYLWPYWEHQKFGYYLKQSLRTNKNYLKHVFSQLTETVFNETDYWVARNKAYANIANVVSSFSRLKDEPESRKKNAGSFYNLALLNYMLLSGTASLAGFLQRHPDQPLKNEQIHDLGSKTLSNLDDALRRLERENAMDDEAPDEESENEMDQINDKIKQDLSGLKESMEQQETDDDDLYSDYANLGYLSRQLKWMYGLSQSIIDRVQKAE